jgi:S-formylglutathione hydrolase FrmB
MRREVTFSALLPFDAPGDLAETIQPMKALYLLHGYGGSHSDWITFSRIRELSGRYNMAVFMPSGENRFFLDDEDKGELLGEYIGNELVKYTCRLFPITRDREDTWIGGLSMGGYGAIRNGLKYAERFGRIIALSSAIIPYTIANIPPDYHNGIAGYSYYRSVFGDLDHLLGSDKDPEALILRLKETNTAIPRIYMACGTDDFLLDVNRRFHQFLAQEKIEHIYDEGPGAHTWDYWNEKLRYALEQDNRA